ncbi:rho GTPase-activating protein 36 isoform X3 [Fukomys damarensis]|uniref:rho GTPase-activating protein 36 isoform X3 n=1 Tax=Fukomys damarensis TaxID=885580 RepID=UPI0014553B03|nr:rho GTPase-activating protein 36 isoform X3 [Fukomys damarensis]
MGGYIPLLKAARTLCPRIMPPLLLLSAFIFLVSVLGGAPGQSPDHKKKMVSVHSLSELERLKLQETAYQELLVRHFLSDFKPNRALTTDRSNTLENNFLVLRGKDRAVSSLKTFGVRLEEVLVNEFTRRKHLQLTAEMQVEEATSRATGRRRRGNVVQRMFGRIRRFFSRTRNEPALPEEFTRRGRRGAVSVDSLAELEDGALLLQTLQLSRVSFPIGQRLLGSKVKMSLNPMAKQIPEIVEACCKFIEEHGLSSVGIFTVEYSAQKVLKLREEFDQCLNIVIDENQNVHDVAALLKEFFRDMKDSLLPNDLYISFLLTATLKPQDQLAALQLLVYLMPPCHSDTLERLLQALHKITEYCEDSIGLDGQLVPPNIQRQVDKRVWKSSPEALDFIRRRNLRKIQSARIKMEEDALLSDPVGSSAEARDAILGQSTPLDEDPEGVPDVEEILNPGENLNHDLEEGPDFEDQQNTELAEVPYLDVIPNNEDDSGTGEIPVSAEDPSMLPGTAISKDEEEAAGNLPNREKDRPLLRVPRAKKAKTGTSYFLP